MSLRTHDLGESGIGGRILPRPEKQELAGEFIKTAQFQPAFKMAPMRFEE